MYDPFVLISMVLDALDYAEQAKDPAGIQRARALLNTEMRPAIIEYGAKLSADVLAQHYAMLYPVKVKELV